MKAASKIEHPTIKKFMSPTCVFISQCYTLVDNSTCGNDLYIGGCQLLNKEYAAGNHDKYHARREAIEKKITRWLEEAIRIKEVK